MPRSSAVQAADALEQWLKRQPDQRVLLPQLSTFYSAHPIAAALIQKTPKNGHTNKKGIQSFASEHSQRFRITGKHNTTVITAIARDDSIESIDAGVYDAESDVVDAAESDVVSHARTDFILVDNEAQLASACDTLSLAGITVLAFDCEGFLPAEGESDVGAPPSRLSLLQVAYDFVGGSRSLPPYIFDLLALGKIIHKDVLARRLKAVLVESVAIKLIHDCHNDVRLLCSQFGLVPTNVLDSQLVFEEWTGNPLGGFSVVLELYGKGAKHSLKDVVKKQMRTCREKGSSPFAYRPLSRDLLEYSAQDVALLLICWDEIHHQLDSGIQMLLTASQMRCDRAAHQDRPFGSREIGFDREADQRLSSRELLLARHGPDESSTMSDFKLTVDTETDQLFALLPPQVEQKLSGLPLYCLRDIIFDLGQPARASFMQSGGNLIQNLSDELGGNVMQSDLDSILERLEGKFGPDNRAGLDGCLHRISAMRNLQDQIYGLTFRVGRSIRGNAEMMRDLLLGADAPSILVMGVPGTGKTTIIREACRMISASNFNVCVVDTSNEICGDGDVPHPSVGLARRMMVPSLAVQGKVMVECLQNHTPDVIVIDEIGRSQEVEAARTVKQRGVRLLASAHGDLRTLVKNVQIRGLVGGVETVTLGDEAAKKMNHSSKLCAQRAGEPCFDVVIELTRGELNSWRVVTNVGKAVDAILAGEKYKAQTRSRDPSDGSISLLLGEF